MNIYAKSVKQEIVNIMIFYSLKLLSAFNPKVRSDQVVLFGFGSGLRLVGKWWVCSD
jgi:hypothetical protein